MKIVIFGLGLIGGSLGRAAVKKTGHTVLGFDISEAARLKAKLLGAVHADVTEENIGEADLVIFALNPSAAVKAMNDTVKKLKDGAVVIDCCGTKRKIIAEMQRLCAEYPEISFAGVHPMAGREFSGIEHSMATLFERAYIIVTPVHTPIEPLYRVKQFFLEIGCEGIVVSSAEKHDKLISYTSQLAHVVSSAYIKNPLAGDYLGFSAGSFRDMTRVAKLNPDMWTELFLENGDNLTEQIDRLIFDLGEYRDAIASGNGKKLRALLAEGNQKKEEIESLRRKKNLSE